MSNSKQDTFEIKIDRNYWEDRTLFLWDKANLKSGISILVGCNGSGKSTLLLHLKNICKNQNIPYLYFDNLVEGGKNRGFEKGMENGQAMEAARFLVSSEGEVINMHMDQFAYKLGQATHDKNIDSSKPFFVLLDGLDSGLSIDNIIEMKKLFGAVLEHEKRSVYIVATANEFTLAKDERCFDVTLGEYIRFGKYMTYHNFILRSRNKKDKLIKEGERCEV